MRAGRLDRRITLQRKTQAENSFGEPVEAWVDMATVWAEKLPLRGSTAFAANQRLAEAETKWRIRYRQNLTPLDRIIDDEGRPCDVLGVLEIGRRVGLEIYTKRRAE